jgi:hypothetical protein
MSTRVASMNVVSVPTSVLNPAMSVFPTDPVDNIFSTSASTAPVGASVKAPAVPTSPVNDPAVTNPVSRTSSPKEQVSPFGHFKLDAGVPNHSPNKVRLLFIRSTQLYLILQKSYYSFMAIRGRRFYPPTGTPEKPADSVPEPAPSSAEATRCFKESLHQLREQSELGRGRPPLERMTRAPPASQATIALPGLPAPRTRRPFTIPIPVFEIAPESVPLPQSPELWSWRERFLYATRGRAPSPFGAAINGYALDLEVSRLF